MEHAATDDDKKQNALELYKLFRDRDIAFINHTRQTVQLFITLISALFGATLVALNAFKDASTAAIPLQPLALFVLIGPLASMIVCRFAQAQYRTTVRRQYQNISILAKLEGLLGLATMRHPDDLPFRNEVSILPKAWEAVDGNHEDSAEFVRKSVDQDHPKRVHRLFDMFFVANAFVGLLTILLVRWDAISWQILGNAIFTAVLPVVGWVFVAFMVWLVTRDE